MGVLGQNEVFNVSTSTTPVLSGTFYRTQISLFFAKWWPNKVGSFRENIGNPPLKKCQVFFKLKIIKKST